MRKTAEMKRLEAERGQDIRGIIRDAVRQHGGVKEAATVEFGMTREGLYNWIARLGGAPKASYDVEFPNYDVADPSPAVAA